MCEDVEKKEALPDMHDVCKALVENAVEFLEKNYGHKVLEQITDMTALAISYGNGSNKETVCYRCDMSFN